MQATIKLTQFSQKLYKCSQDWINKTYMRITGFTWSLLDPCPKKKVILSRQNFQDQDADRTLISFPFLNKYDCFSETFLQSEEI